MSKLLRLSFLFVFFNLIRASTLPRIRLDVIDENEFKMDSAVGPEERAVQVVQNVSIDLCKQDFADLHADMTTTADQAIVYTLTTAACNKNFTFYYLQTQQGYKVEAFQGALDTGNVINIVGTDIGQSFSAPAGVVFVRITSQPNAGSYHQIVASRNDYTVVTDPFISGTEYGRGVQFQKGTEQRAIFYQPANTTEGINGIGLAYMGDCQLATIWKGFQQTESTRIYGASASMCGRHVYRDAPPTFVFSRFLTVAPGKPEDCTIFYGYSRHSANAQIHVNPQTSGVVNSPAYSTPSQPLQNGTHQMDFNFVKNAGVDKIYFQLYTSIAGSSQLIVTEKTNGKPQTFSASDNLCSFSSNDTDIQVSYKWSCGLPPCEDGLIFKWSTENPGETTQTPLETTESSMETTENSTKTGKSISFLFNLSLIIFLVNIFN